MNNNTIFDKIEDWLSGELPEAEARAFEAEMTADAALAAEVERHRRGREALERLAEQALEADMARWRESLDELPEPPADVPRVTGTPHLLRWILSGFLLIILVGVAYWFWPSENIQSGNTPVQENKPPQSQPETPIAVTPTEEPVNEVKNPKQAEEKNSQLIAMAVSNLSDLQGAILQQYGQTMGDDDDENPSFTAGVKAFKQNNLKAAKRDLLLVLKTDPYFPSAQEMLAFIYFREKNYPKAAQCYESYAKQSADPAADWRLLQFYLADYQNHRVEFSKKLEEIADPGNQHRFQKEAERLKGELGQIEIK